MDGNGITRQQQATAGNGNGMGMEWIGWIGNR